MPKYKKKYYVSNKSYHFHENFTLSNRWLSFRSKMIDLNSKCELCGCGGILNIHHRDLNPSNYTDLSNISNFRVLCVECHNLMHLFYKSKEPILDPIVVEQLNPPS